MRAKHRPVRDRRKHSTHDPPKDLEDNPFNPRTVSADTRYISGRIALHLWTLFVLLPVIATILLVMIGVIK